MKQFCLGIIVAIGLTLPAFGQGGDPVIGTWKLNLEKQRIPTYDSTIYTRIGNTINAVRFRTGKPVEVAQIVIVPGKTLTNTAEGIDENNQPYHYVQIYDRQ
jgi:hypothetical protein